jgi:2-polyprenyl-6-hydroxyphenyl methylase/3-demethylubiquinone-9 3-methyltransferase
LTAFGAYSYRFKGAKSNGERPKRDNFSMTSPVTATSVDPKELAKFSAMAADWWDPTGKFRPLHKFNPVRLTFLRDQISAHFDRDPKAPAPLNGLNLLDMGCGGGLLAEPMCRLGANVTGADALEINISVASTHAKEQGLDIDYQATTAEQMLETGAQFDVVLAMEIIEHVTDVPAFLKTCAGLLKPGGLMVLATLNRTKRAYGLAILGAEYILRWVPAGTHQWEKFVKPEEIREPLASEGLTVEAPIGVSYNPLSGQWSISRDSAVNYMMLARKEGGLV